MEYKNNVAINYNPVIIGLGQSCGHLTLLCSKCNQQFTLYINNDNIPKYCCYCGEYLLKDGEKENDK